MEHEAAQTLAARAVALLLPGCEKIAIAGSLRRGKAEVKDIEIVACPRLVSVPATLFGDQDVSALDPVLAQAKRDSALVLDPTVKRDGERYKRFHRVFGYPVVLELFLCTPDNWGNILAIRTGSAEFTHAMVTKQKFQGGLCPDNLYQDGGYLYRGDPHNPGAQIFPCPTEEAFFAALGLPCLPPEYRTAETARRLAELPPHRRFLWDVLRDRPAGSQTNERLFDTDEDDSGVAWWAR